MSKFTSPFGDLTVFKIDGVEYFVGVELCKILAYTNTNKTLADHVPYQYKLLTYDPEIIAEAGFDKRVKSLTLVSEKGVYALAMKSKMPKALEFQDWVYSLLQKIRLGEYGPELQSEMCKHVAPMFQTPEEFYPKNDYRVYGAGMVNQFLQNNYNSAGTSVMINNKGELEQVITDSSKVDYKSLCFYNDPKMIMLAFKLAFGIDFNYLYTCMTRDKMIEGPADIIEELDPEVAIYLESIRNYTILNAISNGFSLEVIQMAADTNNFNSPYNLIKNPIVKPIFKKKDWNIYLSGVVSALTTNYYNGTTPKMKVDNHPDLEDNQ